MKKLQIKDQDLTFAIIKAINTSSGKIDIIRSILTSIKQHTNIEAVGIRLKEDDDFPYYTTAGFPEYFVEAERYLCARDVDNNIIRDTKGNVVLECMCGTVISGKTDPHFPFFTQKGSFFSNCTTKLLAKTTEKERQSRTRNRCNGEGYESVVLIPLSDGKMTIGLLQLNDKRKDMFSKDDIYFFENLGESIGIAVTRKKNEELILMMNTELEHKVIERTKELKKTIEEKNLLLQEVHHRVKNNLYTIVSFLNIQAMNTKNEVVRNALIDAAMRVQSIGTLHQKLYKSDEYLDIDIENYLHDLFSEIYRSYKVEFRQIEYRMDCQGIVMNIDTAIPFGLIMNEIVVNSLKHAFPHKKNGMIAVHVIFTGEVYHVKIADNGVGYDDEIIKEKNESLGMLIIHNLVRQLGGTIDVSSINGVAYDITFARVSKEDGRWKKRKS